MTTLEPRSDDPLSFWSGKTPEQIAIMRDLMEKKNAQKPFSFPFTDAIKLVNSIRPLRCH